MGATILVNLRVMLRSAIFVFVVLVAFEKPAAAYLDPGSGSMLLQALLGGVAAVGVIARLYWHRLSALSAANCNGPSASSGLLHKRAAATPRHDPRRR